MPIYTKKNESILFIHIPKCGGSSFSDFLIRNKYEESLKKMKLIQGNGLII